MLVDPSICPTSRTAKDEIVIASGLYLFFECVQGRMVTLFVAILIAEMAIVCHSKRVRRFCVAMPRGTKRL